MLKKDVIILTWIVHNDRIQITQVKLRLGGTVEIIFKTMYK